MVWKEAVMAYYEEPCGATCEGLRKTRKSSIRIDGIKTEI
jgi:hypothetical protein